MIFNTFLKYIIHKIKMTLHELLTAKDNIISNYSNNKVDKISLAHSHSKYSVTTHNHSFAATNHSHGTFNVTPHSHTEYLSNSTLQDAINNITHESMSNEIMNYIDNTINPDINSAVNSVKQYLNYTNTYDIDLVINLSSSNGKTYHAGDFGINNGDKIKMFIPENQDIANFGLLYMFIYYTKDDGTSSTKQYTVWLNKEKYLEFPNNMTSIIMFARTSNHTNLSGVLKNVQITHVGSIDYDNTRITLPVSQYVTDDMTKDMEIQFPKTIISGETTYNVSNESELRTAITYHNNGNNVRINFINDINISQEIQITGNKKLIINGNNHILTQQDKIYDGVNYINDQRYATYTGTFNVRSGFIGDNCVALRLSKTKHYQVSGQIENEDGSEITNSTTAGIYRVKISEEIQNLGLDFDNTYVNLTTQFYSYNLKVTNISNGYLYFQSTGTSYGLNKDYTFTSQNITANIYFINAFPTTDGVTIKNNKIMWPSKYKTLGETTLRMFNITNNGTYFTEVDFKSITFIGGNAAYNNIRIYDTIVTFEDCTFIGGYANSIYAESKYTGLNQKIDNPYTQIHMKKCRCYDMMRGLVFSHRSTLANVTDCIIEDIGKERIQSFGISANGMFYIARNIITNYGYSAIEVGTNGTYTGNHTGCVERNIIKYTSEYMKGSFDFNIMDSGAIYIGSNVDDITVRYNTIINYSGRSYNNGIYCDDGCHNFVLLGNIIQTSTGFAGEYSNGYSISARYATGRGDNQLDYNINKIVLYNIVDNAICLEGDPNVENNGCYMGYNIQINNKAIIDNRINNLQGQETLYLLHDIDIIDGIINTQHNLYNWKLKAIDTVPFNNMKVQQAQIIELYSKLNNLTTLVENLTNQVNNLLS